MKEADINLTYVLLRDVPTMDWDDEGIDILPAGTELIKLERVQNKNFRNHIWYYCVEKNSGIKYSIRYIYAEFLAELNEENLEKIRKFKFAQIEYFKAMSEMDNAFKEITTLK